MTEEPSASCIVVVEQGANSAAQMVGAVPSDATDCALIAQQPGESPVELALRAVRRARDFSRRKVPLVLAVILVNDASRDEVLASRCTMARAMVRAMSDAPKARLLFVPPESLPADGRHELLAIAGTLALELGKSGSVEISVRFTSAARDAA